MGKQLFIQIQVALFFKSDFLGMPENASLAIKEQFGNDMTTQILGIPANAPSEIPRVTANSSVVNINLSKNRIDFFSKNQEFLTTNLDKMFNIIEKISVTIGRVGIVFTYFKEGEIKEIKSIFDQSKIDNLDPKEITVRFDEKKEIAGIMSNSSQKYVSGFANDEVGVKKRGIIITRDINTLQEDINKNSFNKETLNKFIIDSIFEADKILI